MRFSRQNATTPGWNRSRFACTKNICPAVQCRIHHRVVVRIGKHHRLPHNDVDELADPAKIIDMLVNLVLAQAMAYQQARIS